MEDDDTKYQSKYCKIKNGMIVGLDMKKIRAKQRAINRMVKDLKKEARNGSRTI